MATNYPTGTDTFLEPTDPTTASLGSAGAGGNTRIHSVHHRDLGDAVEALEAYALRRGDALGVSYVSGLWHSPAGATQGTSTAGTGLNDLVVFRWDFPPGFQVTGLGEAIATAATAASGAVRKLCVYSDNGTGCYPGSLLIDGGTAYSVESTGIKTQTFAAVTCEGIKWVGGVTQVSAAALQYRTLNEMGRGMAMAAITDVQWTGYVHAGVSGAFPGTFTATRAISTSAPKVYVQAA